MPFSSILLGLLATSAIAVGAVSVPVIIHLLNRKRFRVVTWAAMRFLLAAQRKNTRRMRLEQLLLLLVRMLVVLLLVLSMASVLPWAEELWRRLFPASAAQATTGVRRTHKVVVIDGSFSMALKVGDHTCFDRARILAEQLVRDSTAGDGFTVVLMTAPPRRVIVEPSEDVRKVAEEIAALHLPHGNADLAGTLHVVESMLRESPGKFEEREVYFFTDLQRSTWTSEQGNQVKDTLQRIQAHSRTILVDVGQETANNCAVANLTLGVPLVTTGAITPLAVTIRNYGNEERQQVQVELLIGKARSTSDDAQLELQVAGKEIVDLPPGQTLTVPFQHKFGTPGDYVVQARLDGDPLELDDVRTVVLSVKDDLPVMLVNGKRAVEVYDRATEWLRDALNPFQTGLVPRNIPARPKVVSESQFDDAGQGDLTAFDCVFICDVKQLNYAEIRRLETHLRRGGGVVFCLGPQVDLEAYNRLIWRKGEGILPGELRGHHQAPEDQAWTLQADEESFRLSPLDAFAADNDRASLQTVRFRHYIEVDHLNPRARKILSFVPEPMRPADGRKPAVAAKAMASGHPAVIEWPRYRGRVLLVTTTVNLDWTTWPISPSYPPLMQELMRFAVAGRLREQANLVGETLEEYLPSSSGELAVVVLRPDGKRVETQTQAHEEATLLRWTDTDQSGLYRATVGQHPREYVFAVNVPVATDAQQASESDLARTNRTELQSTFTNWEFQLVSDLREVERRPLAAAEGTPVAPTPPPINTAHTFGAGVARILLLTMAVFLFLEVVLAWRFGHYSTTAGAAGAPPATGWLVPTVIAALAVMIFLGMGAILLHEARTEDFLSFMPEQFRRAVEQAMGVPQPVAGEGTRWRLEYTPFLTGRPTLDRWLVGGLALGAVVLVAGIYWQEGRTAGGVYKGLLVGLRYLFILLALVILLPQIRLWFERQGWPDVAIIIDDSRSMSTIDRYQDPQVQELASKLAVNTSLPARDRLQIAQALLARNDGEWLQTLLTNRKVKIHVYHCSGRAARLADLAEPTDVQKTVDAISSLQAEGESSQLGTAVRQVLNDYRGSSLSAIIMMTDGVTTEGEDLAKVSRYSAQMGVPLFFVGIGDAQEPHDLQLHDLRVEDMVYVRDNLVFEGRLTAQGYTNLRVPVRLLEKDKNGNLTELSRDTVTADPFGKPVKFQVIHQPKEPGERVYVLDVPGQPDEVDSNNNRLERTVQVREAKAIRVLYVEGYPRYDFRFIKTLLERELEEEKGQKSIELSVLLLDADEDYPRQDRSARGDFPSTKEELGQYQVIILGDVDPENGRIKKHLRNLAEWVRERGGGLLMIAGPYFSPHAYRDTPLADILPIKMSGPRPADRASVIVDTFRPQLTPVGRMHPIFRFVPDELDNANIWNHLPEILWYSEGYQTQPAAEVLAVHPRRKAEGGERRLESEDRHPLVIQHFVGAGRCMFLGIEETWRWRLREDETHFNQFWQQLITYLSRSRLGRTDLRLDRQTPYRRGEPIRITVRFPDDLPPPDPSTEIKVVVERKAMKGAGDAPERGGAESLEVQTIKLAKVEGSRATYEAILSRTPEGDYKFWLSSPAVSGSRPRAECKVLAPPGEMERLRMNQPEMERAAEETRGRFYTLANFDQLMDDLPAGTRVSLNTPRPPWLLWNHWSILLLGMLLLSSEWILRKRKHLL